MHKNISIFKGKFKRICFKRKHSIQNKLTATGDIEKSGEKAAASHLNLS